MRGWHCCLARGERREERGESLLSRQAFNHYNYITKSFTSFTTYMNNDFFYKKVLAYQKAKELTIYVYTLLRKFPSYELYGMCDQLRRASVSIPSNIAEGLGRMSIKERIRFLEISYASLTEVSCQLDIALSLGYVTDEELSNAERLAAETGKLLSGLRKSLIDKQPE